MCEGRIYTALLSGSFLMLRYVKVLAGEECQGKHKHNLGFLRVGDT